MIWTLVIKRLKRVIETDNLIMDGSFPPQNQDVTNLCSEQ